MPYETFLGRLKVGVTGGVNKGQMVIYLACPGHNLYIYAWISKQFCTVVVLKEEKCHLTHFFSDRLKVKVTEVK